MKRLFLLLTGLVLCFQAVKAQKYSFGIFADPQVSWFTSDTKKYDPNGAVSGFNIGFSSERFFAQRYSFLSGLSINNLGGNIRFTQSTYTLKTVDSTYTIEVGKNIKYKSQYLTLPLGFKFRTNQIGYTTFFANLGISGSLRIRSHVWSTDYQVDRETTKTDVAWGFASYFIGVGGEYSLGGESALQFGIIWTDGLTSILEYPASTITSQSLSLKIGVIF
ncbi:porin family protein [Tenuifilum thalassicum]|uniref:PorT family protein n=1 Tax=Tenuifilum thalassicum TaxID=2590900 RepID=A0A7D3XCS0_9BACT|nr:porin family protein [Tenuifilum thalassicum]QKG79252.1 PorT family protein [Tenuifilum thalassicum]